MLDLEAPARALQRLADGVTDDQLGAPTPCAGTDVGSMLAHLIGLSLAFADGARKVQGPTTSTPPTAAPLDLPDDWRAALAARLDELVLAWRDPGAWEGETTVGGVTGPAGQMAAFGNDELVLHGWDLAVATGQPYAVAPANLEAAWQVVSGVPADPAARQGLFGPVVAVAEDAPLLDRVLGGAGRDPGWKPPS
jgi:uncharacterized protein (TIGR03086 family)